VARFPKTGAEGSSGRRMTLASAEARSCDLADRAPVDRRYRSHMEFETLSGDRAHVEALRRRSFNTAVHSAVVFSLDAEGGRAVADCVALSFHVATARLRSHRIAGTVHASTFGVCPVRRQGTRPDLRYATGRASELSRDELARVADKRRRGCYPRSVEARLRVRQHHQTTLDMASSTYGT
jgi:hypothetical protein